MNPSRPTSIRLLPFGLALSLTSACAAPPAAGPTVGHEARTTTAWAYEGPTGQAHWGEIDPTSAACGQGTSQSPIDLGAAGAREAAPPAIHWEPLPVSVVNTGHTVQVDGSGASTLLLDGTRYTLDQFHFHTPSDHTVDGRSFDAELHAVHRSADGRLAAVAIFFTRGAESAVLRPLFDALPTEKGERRQAPGKTIDLARLLPPAPRFLSYEGSLTVPPCTEGVRWLVVVPDRVQELADDDLAKLRVATHGPTNRAIQPRNGRTIELR